MINVLTPYRGQARPFIGPWECQVCLQHGRPGVYFADIGDGQRHALEIHGMNLTIREGAERILGAVAEEHWNDGVSEEVREACRNLTWVRLQDGRYGSFATAPVNSCFNETPQIRKRRLCATDSRALPVHIGIGGLDYQESLRLYYFRNEGSRIHQIGYAVCNPV